MSNQYHYLVAGLPDIIFDDTKLSMDSKEYRQMLSESLSDKDMELIRLYFYRYDNKNILARLQDAEASLDTRGNLDDSDLQEIFDAVKGGTTDNSGLNCPQYIIDFIVAYKADSPILEGKSWELQLSELYFDFATDQSNTFIKSWFAFDRDMQNILTAAQCRKHDMSVEGQLIGSGEIVEKLNKSNARDFGIDNEFPMLDQILKAAEEEDLKEFEKKIDMIKWNYLDEEVFFHYFTIEKLFTFLIKLSIIERWISLDKETGQKLFNELLEKMEASYEFPDEFKLKK